MRVDLDERPPEVVEITAYFVIAEALANVAKHSGASEARVSVRKENDAGSGGYGEDFLVVEAQDDGRGEPILRARDSRAWPTAPSSSTVA